MDAQGVNLKAKEHAAVVADASVVPCIGSDNPSSDEKVVERVRALGVIIDVRGRAQICVVGKGPKVGGDEGAGDGAGVHFTENYPWRFEEADGRVDGQQLTGWAQCQRKRIVHREPVSCPVPFVARELGELLGAVRGSGHGLK